MRTRRDFLKSSAAAALAAPLTATGALAQEQWPAREIRSIAMFPPGSGADVIVRFYAKKLEDKLGAGRRVIVENRPGAFGALAAQYVARSKPDGYTIFIAPGSSVLAAAPHVFKSLTYNPVDDFDHITLLARLPFIMMVSADRPWKTVADLTAFLKEQGDKASYGSVANPGLVGAELYKAHFGLKTVEVKYKDPAGAYNDLIGGNLAFTHIDPTAGLAWMKQGKVRPLCVTSAERTKALPDIPGAREAGILNSDIQAWWSVHTPKGTPAPVLAQLEKYFNEMSADPEVVKFLAGVGIDSFPGNSKMVLELLKADIKNWGEYVKLAKIEPV